MNLMVLAAFALILICSLVGYKRGLIKSAVSAVGIVGAILLANLLNPYVDQFLCKKTQIRAVVRQKIEKNIGADRIDERISVYEQEDYLENMDIPEIVKNYIRSSDKKQKNINQTYSIKGYVDYVVDYLTDMAMNGISFLTTVLLVLLFVIIALALSRILSGIPIVGGIDKAGGLLFGIAQAVLLIWISMVLLTFLSAFSWAEQMLQMIDDSSTLSWMYKNNFFLKMIIDILGDI